jgi:exopolyphosphatase/guanosine-5'-triphosphate,3'-diphosphate pyrophosphatase
LTSAAIDIGTNSIKMTVGTVGPDGRVRFLGDACVITRLGEGVDSSGRISEQGLQRSLDALRELIETAHRFGVDEIRMVGTSAIRDAANQVDIIRRFKDEVDVDIEVLSEADECRLSYMAVALDAVLGKYDGTQVTFDIGGGSTELTIGSGREMHDTRSVKIGAVRLTERFLKDDPPTISDMRAAGSCADDALGDINANGIHVGRAVGIGGSVINLARVCKGISVDRTEDVHGTFMSLQDVESIQARLASVPLAERKSLIGLEPERTDIIIAGAIILERVLKVFGVGKVLVSMRGLRHGVLSEMFGGLGVNG